MGKNNKFQPKHSNNFKRGQKTKEIKKDGLKPTDFADEYLDYIEKENIKPDN
ncbi:MAG: hypothetical protein GDA51_11240 [Ekhidna sp.]|nr:hypothetical protein [Ekhidna sp.]